MLRKYGRRKNEQWLTGEEGVYGEEMEGNEEEWSRFKEAILEGGGEELCWTRTCSSQSID